MTHWHTLNIFPQPFIDLQRELPHHPILQSMLAQLPAAEWELRLAQIAQYCSIVLDGSYLPEDIEKICSILVKRLVELRVDNRGVLVLS